MGEVFSALQSVPLVGALVAGFAALVFYLGNGLKEKREGRREGIAQERARNAEQSVKAEREIREGSRNVEDMAERVRAGGGDTRSVQHAEHAPGDDIHYRD